MKKRILEILLIITLLFFYPRSVSAASTCSYARQNELNAIANNIKASVLTEKKEVSVAGSIEGEGDVAFLDEHTTFMIQLLNLQNDIYIEIKNKDTGEVKTYTTQDFKDASLKFETSNRYEAIEYEITVYSNDKDCLGDLLRKTQVTTPKINIYSTYSFCDGMKDYYLCREVVNGNTELTEDKIYNSVSRYKAGLEDEEGIPQEPENSNTNWIYLIIVVGILGLAGIVIIVLKGLKRRKIKIWER